MTTSPSQIANAVAALADHIVAKHEITFRQLFEYVESLGIDTVGGEELTCENVGQPNVGILTALRDNVSKEFVQIVTALFHTRPVVLEIGPFFLFESGEEPWLVTPWTCPTDQFVNLQRIPVIMQAINTCTEYVRERGTATFMQLADAVDSMAIHGEETMMVGTHSVGDGVTMTPMSNPPNVVLWNGATSEFLAVIEGMLAQEPRVVLERADDEYYGPGGHVLRTHYEDADGEEDDGPRLPVIGSGERIAQDGYREPEWLPVKFVWAGRDYVAFRRDRVHQDAGPEDLCFLHYKGDPGHANPPDDDSLHEGNPEAGA